MSELGSESGDYTYASPSPVTRKNGPFLDATMIPSDDADSERSSDQEDGALSQSTQSDDQSGEPITTTSTPNLSFAASSSPFLFSTAGSSSLHPTGRGHLQSGNVASLPKSTFEHTPFVRCLDYLLQEAADQQRYSRTSDSIRIQPDSPEGLAGPKSQMVSIAHDEVLESALCQRGHGYGLSPFPSRNFLRYSSLLGDTSDDNTLATVSVDAGVDSRQNKRKAKAAINEDSDTPATSFFHDGDSSDSYLSASDGGPPAPSCCPVGRHPPSKKRKCLSLDTQLSVVSPHPGFSNLSNTPSVQEQQGSQSNTTRDATKGVQSCLHVIPVSISSIVPGICTVTL